MEILNLLFDEYTQKLFSRQVKTESQTAQAQYQKLKELTGVEEANDIWDAAVGEGAVMQEDCFQVGLRGGIALALELLSL